MHYRSVRTVTLPTTLEDFYLMGCRQEGHVCELRTPPNCKLVHGYIAVPSTPEQLFFQEGLSGITKRETGNIRMNTIVQFSVDKNEHGFFAKNLFIKVRRTSSYRQEYGTGVINLPRVSRLLISFIHDIRVSMTKRNLSFFFYLPPYRPSKKFVILATMFVDCDFGGVM